MPDLREAVWDAVKSVYDRHRGGYPLNHVNVVEWVDAVLPVVEDQVAHAGCQRAHERQKRRADFAEERLESLVIEFRELAFRLDGIGGHTGHERLGGKSLGGAVRAVLKGEKDE